MNFWNDLKRPVLILAPMDDVTDTVFRQVVASVGRPDVFFTEFTSVDGLLSEGYKHVAGRLLFKKDEKPIVAQIWGNDPDKFFKAAQLIADMGFDGIDINMGCPTKDVVSVNACSALIKDPKRAKEIIKATMEGSKGLPVSVKTRIGFSTIDTENWVSQLLELPLAALTLHFRTRKEMSKVPAHWEEAKVAVAVKKRMNSNTLLIGNGDVKSLEEAHEKAMQYELDGSMVGRGIFENVWLFNPEVDIKDITIKDRLTLLLKHIDLFNTTWGTTKNFAILKKFVKCYLNGFDRASQMRVDLMASNSLEELRSKTQDLLVK